MYITKPRALSFVYEFIDLRRRIRHLSPFFFPGAGICKCSKNRSQSALIVATITHGIERLEARPVFPKRESHPDPACKRLVLFFESIHVTLFLAYLGIFGHVIGRGEVVIVSRVVVRVESRNKRCRGTTKVIPWDRFEEGMNTNCIKSTIPCACVCNESKQSVRKCILGSSCGDLYRVIASHATSVKLKIKSSGLSYSGRRKTLVQFLRLVHVSSGVPPLKGGKPARNSNKMHPKDQ